MPTWADLEAEEEGQARRKFDERKHRMTIQPMECSCLPELALEMISTSIAEKLNTLQKLQEEANKKLLSGDRAILDVDFLEAHVAILDKDIEDYKYLALMLSGMPVCKGK